MTDWNPQAPAPPLEDRQAMIDVAVRYCWALDQRDFDDLTNVFTQDAVADYGFAAPLEGAKTIAEYVASVLNPLDVSHHLVSNHQFVVDGEGARARCYLQAQHTRKGFEGGENYLLGGLYHDRFVRMPEGWRIAHRRLDVVWTEGNPAVVAPPRR